LNQEKAGSVADRAEALRQAAANGDLATLRLLHQQGTNLRAGNDEALRLAAAGGYLEIIRYLHQNGVAIRSGEDAALHAAAAGGQLGVVRYLHENGVDLHARANEVLRLAAAHGHLEVVKYLHESGADLRADNDALLRMAASEGHLHVLDYLHENGVELAVQNNAALRAAAAQGHLEVVKYLHQNGVDIHTNEVAALRLAAAHGHLNIIRYLRETGTDLGPHKEELLRLAAANGHLATVQYLHEYGADPRSVEAGGEALRLAAAGGHAAVVKYLHENGAVTTNLSEEGRACIEAMNAEISTAPAIYHPSNFWKEVGAGHTQLLSWTGEANFKRTINQNFFNCIPVDPDDPQIVHLSRLVPQAERKTTPGYRLEGPDCDPGLWTSWLPSYQIFKVDPPVQHELYLRLVRALHEFVLAHDSDGFLQRLEEPTLGNPIRLWRNHTLISQDLANSVWERNVIVSGLASRGLPGSLAIAELGAGYGRLGHVLLATVDCRYMVFDIPPALYVSQWYLSTLFPGKRLFRFRPFREFSEVETELSQADIAFLTANQLEKFPPGYFDVFVNISSLHEMRPEQIGHFLGHMARTSRRLIYLKEYKSYRNPYDAITIGRSDYALPAGWDVALERSDVLNPDFFELLAHPEVNAEAPVASTPPE
jgi:putative sugar O-methyltransferase